MNKLKNKKFPGKKPAPGGARGGLSSYPRKLKKSPSILLISGQALAIPMTPST